MAGRRRLLQQHRVLTAATPRLDYVTILAVTAGT